MQTPLVTEQLSPDTYWDYTKFVALIRFTYQHRYTVSPEVIQPTLASLIAKILKGDPDTVSDAVTNLDDYLERFKKEPVPPAVFFLMAFFQASSYLQHPEAVQKKPYMSLMLALGHFGAACYAKDPAQVLEELTTEFERMDDEFTNWILVNKPSPSKEFH